MKQHIQLRPQTHRRTKRWSAMVRLESKHHNGRRAKRDLRRRKST
jgi:hypothetical protein